MIDPMPRQDVELPPPYGYVTVKEYKAEVLARAKAEQALAHAEARAWNAAIEAAASWMIGQSLTKEEMRQGYGFTVDYPYVAARSIRALRKETP